MPNVPTDSGDDDLIPTSEAAAILGRDVATIARWVRDGRLTPVVQTPGIRGARLFRRSDIEALLEAGKAST